MAPIEIGRVRQEFKPGLENLIAGVIIGLLLIGGSCAITFFAVKAVFENRGHLAFWVDKGPSWGAVLSSGVPGRVALGEQSPRATRPRTPELPLLDVH
jgi:hypothetical protein